MGKINCPKCLNEIPINPCESSRLDRDIIAVTQCTICGTPVRYNTLIEDNIEMHEVFCYEYDHHDLVRSSSPRAPELIECQLCDYYTTDSLMLYEGRDLIP